jgi:transcriptional regulator with XRE-family HTH domain
MTDSIGKRIAFLRQKHGWTQQSFANRLAMSRVAISHMEMDLSIPSERSIILMAGIFKLSPLEMVENTTYPHAKWSACLKSTHSTPIYSFTMPFF